MGSEMFELCDTSHYFVFRLVGLALNKSRKLPKSKQMRCVFVIIEV